MKIELEKPKNNEELIDFVQFLNKAMLDYKIESLDLGYIKIDRSSYMKYLQDFDSQKILGKDKDKE